MKKFKMKFSVSKKISFIIHDSFYQSQFGEYQKTLQNKTNEFEFLFLTDFPSSSSSWNCETLSEVFFLINLSCIPVKLRNSVNVIDQNVKTENIKKP